jgi:hypothetical protein
MASPVRGATPDLDAAAADAIRAGLTPRAAARRYGVPVTAVRDAMRRHAYQAKRLAGTEEREPADGE